MSEELRNEVCQVLLGYKQVLFAYIHYDVGVLNNDVFRKYNVTVINCNSIFVFWVPKEVI